MKKNNFIGKVFITKTFEETQKLGRDFAKTLKNGDVVCLYGDLGSGKTTFVQGLAQGLGIDNRIISPTFVIVRSYELQSPAFVKTSARKQNSKLKTTSVKLKSFYHIDLYRMGGEEDIKSLGLDEIINNKNNISAIEWAEKLGEYCPQKAVNIEFIYEKNDTRRIVFRSLNQ